MNYAIVDEYIGSKIKEVRESKRYSVIEMANLVNVSRQAYYHYEDGKISIPIDRCKFICTYLGIDYIDLMQNALNYTIDNINKEIEELEREKKERTKQYANIQKKQ